MNAFPASHSAASAESRSGDKRCIVHGGEFRRIVVAARTDGCGASSLVCDEEQLEVVQWTLVFFVQFDTAGSGKVVDDFARTTVQSDGFLVDEQHIARTMATFAEWLPSLTECSEVEFENTVY